MLRNPTASYEQKEFSITTVLEGPNPRKGWAIMEKAGSPQHAIFETKSDVGDGQSTLLFTLRHDWGQSHQIGKFRLSATTDARPIRVEGKQFPKEIQDIFAVDPAKRTDAQKNTLAAHYRSIAPALDPARRRSPRPPRPARSF